MPKEIDEFVAPIPYIIPAQLFAALLADAKGLDPDKPRSLSKVTRTVLNIELRELSAGPVYAQVREQIETQIGSKVLSSGETLPSPAALAQKLSVDKGEVQRAYFELEHSGLIKKETGKDFLGHPRNYRVLTDRVAVDRPSL